MNNYHGLEIEGIKRLAGWYYSLVLENTDRFCLFHLLRLYVPKTGKKPHLLGRLAGTMKGRGDFFVNVQLLYTGQKSQIKATSH